MKKVTLIVMIALLGCNNGSSIANSLNTAGSTSVAPGGTAGTTNGGATGSFSGGATGNSAAGATGTTTGGSTSQGGTTGTATGGSTGTATGGSPGGTGGVQGTGGNIGTGGAGTPDASADAVGKNDADPADTRKLDVNGTGGAQGTDGATTACVPPATGGPKGMKTGQACMDCHGSGQNPKITAGGTVYSSASGGAAVAGATVTITGSNGAKITMVTGNSGNFYTGSAISFPATVQVSKCPDVSSMVATISDGNCNKCHDSSKRVHLP